MLTSNPTGLFEGVTPQGGRLWADSHPRKMLVFLASPSWERLGLAFPSGDIGEGGLPLESSKSEKGVGNASGLHAGNKNLFGAMDDWH